MKGKGKHVFDWLGKDSEELASRLARSWRKDTSYDPKGWSVRNRAWGQCAVTALIVQDLLGGKLLRGKVNGYEHYWNLLPNDRELDLTLRQFGVVVEASPPVEVSRDFVLSFPDTVLRYRRLQKLVPAPPTEYNPSLSITSPARTVSLL